MRGFASHRLSLMDESVIFVRGNRERNFDRLNSGLAHRVRSVQNRRLFFEKTRRWTKTRLVPLSLSTGINTLDDVIVK